ncbi:hypothetical protein CARUB_v100039380mg, partial [Capsella rubella]
MEALFTSTHIPNLQTRPLLKSSLPTSSQSSSCWFCSSLPKRQFSKLRISNGSSHGLRVQALLRNETPSEGEDNMADSSGFDFFSGGVFSLSQENLGSNLIGESCVIDVDALTHHQGGGGNRAGLFRTPISGGVQNATSANA